MSGPATLKIVYSTGVFKDISLVALANGKITFQPTDNHDVPIPVTAADGTQALFEPVTRSISSGAMASPDVNIPNPASASPQNYRLRISVLNSSTQKTTVYRNVLAFDTGGGQFDLSKLDAGYASPQIPVTRGPQGQGFNFRGPWAPSTTYAAYDVVTNGGSTYVVTTGFTSGASFDATNMSVSAAKGTDGATSPNFTSAITAPGITVPAATTGTSVLMDIPTAQLDNAFSLIDATVDAAGRVISGTMADGTAWFPGSVQIQALAATTLTSTSLTGTSISAGGGSADTAMPTDAMSNQFGLLHAVVDSAGFILSGIMPDGTAWFPGGVKGIPQSTSDTDSEGFLYYTQLVGSYWQIFRRDDVGNIMQLTSGNYNNINPRVAVNDSMIIFATDRTGSFTIYQMDRGGLMQLPIGTDTNSLVNLNGISITGQSLSTGWATTATTLTQPLDNLGLNGGPRSGSALGIAVNPANLTSLVPLVEVQGATVSGTSDDANSGETVSSTLANRLAQMSLDRGIRFRVAAAVNGRNSTAYFGIKIGTVPFTNGITQVTKIHSLAAAQSLTHATRAMVLIHGENDEVIANPSYYANIQQLRSDTSDQHQAVTGQSYGVPLFLCQESSWTKYVPEAVGIIPYQQLRAMTEQIGRIFLVCPKYFLPYLDGVHISTAGQMWLAEYYARAMFNVLILKRLWRPIYPRKIQRLGNKIYIRFWVPAGNSLVIDTTLVTPPTANPAGLYGFEYTDNTSPPAITGVALTPGTTDGVTITLASVPTGTSNRIRYAYTGTSGALGGPTTGARGNLRDNDSTASTTGQANMYNWCCHFDYSC